MSRHRLVLTAIWCGLAIATIGAIIAVKDDTLTHAAAAALAWLCGVASVRLHDDVRGRRRA